ncbi:MAG: CHAP domain-containing protein [Myxococcaceae bacterium]
MLFVVTGCATGVPLGAHSTIARGHLRPFGAPAYARSLPNEEPVASSTVSLKGGREEIVSLAKSLLGKSAIKVDGKRYPDDCTGLVTALYEQLGVKLTLDAKPGDNAVTAIYRYAQRHGQVFDSGHPLPGDLVFFHETYDQNRDGRMNDGLTHIGVVEESLEDGTVLVIHRVKRGVVRYRMNLARKDLRKDPATGQVLNDLLKAAAPGSREVLTGQLFSAYGSLLPSASVSQK